MNGTPREARRAARLPLGAATADPPAAAPPAVTSEDVLACYRWILAREPESERVLAHHAALSASPEELRARFLASEEFRQSLLEIVPPEAGPPPEAETAATTDELDRLMTWQCGLWARLGEEAPYWSSLPDERFRGALTETRRRAFHASGAAEAAALVALLARQRLAPEDMPRLLHHGCGVGRVTLHLAQHFPEISALDVSPGHLALARKEAQARGLVHLRWLRARPGLPMPAEGYDLWYSRRTLQWNPPPLIRRTLELAFAGLAPGGFAVFQVPTWQAGYRFATRDHLAGAEPAAPALHLLPQAEIFALAAAAGLAVLEVVEDSHLPVPAPGPLRSQLFVLRKPR